MSKLFIIRGIPGSGKSTYASRLKQDLIRFGYNEKDIVHAEADMFFLDENNNYNFDKTQLHKAHKECFSKIENALANNKIAIVSNTFVDKSSVTKYVKLGELYNAEITIYRMTGNHKNVHDVPVSVVEDMRKRFDNVYGEILR